MNRFVVQAVGICILSAIFMQYSVHAVECPPEEIIVPCTCKKISNNIIVYCSGIRFHEILRKIFDRVDGWKFDKLSIEGCSMLYIPASIFEKAEFRELYIERSTLTSLFDSEPISVSSIKEVRIDFSTIQQGIRWSLLTNFELDTFIVFDTPIRELGKEFREHVGKSDTLRLLSFVLNGIRRITNQPFENLINLNQLNLDNQKFTDLEPLIFPQDLKTVTIRASNLTTLPDNFFGNRPTLEVRIGNNRFTTISKKIFGGIKRLYIEDNPLDCTCGMKWITDDKTKFRAADGTCVSPSTVRNKEVDKLEASDFSYCR